jgi:hypothetical protein
MCSVLFFPHFNYNRKVSTNFHANASGWSRVVPYVQKDGRIDMTGLLVAIVEPPEI